MWDQSDEQRAELIARDYDQRVKVPAEVATAEKGLLFGTTTVDGPDTDTNVYRLLDTFKERSGKLRHVSLGRIKGDQLDYQGRQYLLLLSARTSETDTVSLRLGEGIFYLMPVAKETVGVLRLVAGSAYQVQQVDAHGNLMGTDLRIMVQGLEPRSEGMLVYSARTMVFAATSVDVKRPRDIDALAETVIRWFDEILYGYSTSLYPQGIGRRILETLQKENLSPKETMDLLERLRLAGRLSQFISLIPHTSQLGPLLRQRQVPWEYIYANWTYNINDSGSFWAGYAVGAAENVYEGIRFLYLLVGALISKDIDRQLDEYRAAFRKFFAHPLTNLEGGAIALYDAFQERLWELDFFAAGRLLGNAVVTILTLIADVRSLPALIESLQAFAKTTITLVQLGIRDVQAMGVTLEELAQFISGNMPAMDTVSGVRLTDAGSKYILVMSTATKDAATAAQVAAVGVLTKDAAQAALGTGALAEAMKKAGEQEELVPLAETSRDYFKGVYKDLQKSGYKPSGPKKAIKPDPNRYPTVEIRPNGDAVGSYEDLRRYLQDNQVTGRRSIETTIEAHHLLEDNFMSEYFGISREKGFSVSLDSDEHGIFSREVPRVLAGQAPTARGQFYDIDQLFKAHARAYSEAGYPEWIDDMRDFLRQNRTQIKSYYRNGRVPGAELPDYPERLARVVKFMDSL